MHGKIPIQKNEEEILKNEEQLYNLKIEISMLQ
jgi:hypothetical protein